MLARIILTIVVIACRFNSIAHGQSTDTSAQARNILTQMLNASGYSSNPISGFTANGTITYFGGLGSQAGTVTIKARGHDQFRMDSTLTGGVRTISFSGASGRRKEADGNATDLPAQNSLAVVNLVLPYMELAKVLTSSDYRIAYQGLTSEEDRQLHQLRVRRIITSEQDSLGLVEDLTQVDYFLDAKSLQVAKIASTTTAINNVNEQFSQVIELEKYVGKGGLAVPTVIRLRVADSRVWEMHLTDLSAVGNLTDADFTIQ
jgi:hypothetical protein